MPNNEFYHGNGVFSKRLKDGTEAFYIRYGFKGRNIKERVEGGLEDARLEIAIRRRDIERGTFRPVPARKRGMTFTEFYEQEFMPKYGSLRKSKYYAQHRKDLTGFFGDKPLTAITRQDIEEFKRESPKTRRCGPSTMRKQLVALSTMFRFAMAEGLVDENPVANVARPKEPSAKDRHLTPEEYQTIFDKAAPWLRPFMTFAVHTGMRRGEQLRLTWDDIDFANNQIYVSEENKTGDSRYVRMTASVRSMLQGLKKRDREIMRQTDPAKIIPYVFIDSTGEPYLTERRAQWITRWFQIAVGQAGIKRNVRWHDLRHTTASWMVQAGRSMYETGEFLGHKDPKTTKRYAHLMPDHLQQAADALEAVLQAKDGSEPRGASEGQGA